MAFHSDRESNFSATTFEMLKQGIRLIQTAAGVHERTAERYIKGIRDGVKATLEQIRKDKGKTVSRKIGEIGVRCRDVVTLLQTSTKRRSC